MASKKVVFASIRLIRTLVALKQYASIEMLDCSALQSFKTLCSGVCTPPKARVDAVDDGAVVELLGEKVDALLDPPENNWVIGQARRYAVADESQAQLIEFGSGVKGLYLL